MIDRRGFSLIEVMISLVTAALLGSLVAGAIGHLQIVGRSRGERSGLAGSLRATIGALQAEIQSLGNDSIAGVDHRSSGSSSLTYRAHRGLVVVCRVAVDTIVLALNRLPAFRSRVPSPLRDSLLLYLPGDTTTSIDAWLPLSLLTGPFAVTCPGGGVGSLYPTRLAAVDLSRFLISGATVGRIFETVNARLYSSASGPQFGLEEVSAGATIQPVAGPLEPTDGLEFLGWNRTGGPPTTPFDVAGFELTVRAIAARELAVGPGLIAPASDSALGAVLLRNAR